MPFLTFMTVYKYLNVHTLKLHVTLHLYNYVLLDYLSNDFILTMNHSTHHTRNFFSTDQQKGIKLNTNQCKVKIKKVTQCKTRYFSNWIFSNVVPDIDLKL